MDALTEVQKLDLHDGDVIVFRLNEKQSPAVVETIGTIVQSLPVKTVAVILSPGEEVYRLTSEQLRDMGLRRVPRE